MFSHGPDICLETIDDDVYATGNLIVVLLDITTLGGLLEKRKKKN